MKRRAAPDRLWSDLVQVWLLLTIDASLAVTGIWPTNVTVSALVLTGAGGAAVLAVAGWATTVRHRRRERCLRAELGLSTLRRRLHGGLAMAAWFMFSLVAVLVVFILGHQTEFIQSPGGTTSPCLLVIFSAWVHGGTVVAGVVQAVRRRLRDREIDDADLPLVDLVRVDAHRPPAWMPTRWGSGGPSSRKPSKPTSSRERRSRPCSCRPRLPSWSWAT